jgi:RNA polymerase sigma-70 factor (ECF subfamily)
MRTGSLSSGLGGGEPGNVVSDKRLVEITLAGDPEAFGQLVERYEGAVYALVCHYTGKYGEAEDLAQEAFLEAYRSLKRLREHDKFCAWLRGITYRVCMNWLRREEKRHQRTVFRRDEGGADEISYKAIISAEVSVERELARKEVREAVLEAIASLPEKYQLPVVLRYLQELSYEEIGRFMDLPKSTVRGILYRANKILREELHDVWARGEIGWPPVNE